MTARAERYPVPHPLRLVLGRVPRGLPGRASPRRSTTSTATSWPGATRRATLHVQDAFCPHLGAHLGHGGTVDGCEIACPFHGWKFDADGNNTDIPYCERTNRRATLRTYPVVERNGSASPGTTPTPTSRRCGRSRSSPSSTTIPTGRPRSARAHRRRRLAGDGRERRRLRPLPLRAQHRRGAGDGELRDRVPGHARCARARSSPRPVA